MLVTMIACSNKPAVPEAATKTVDEAVKTAEMAARAVPEMHTQLFQPLPAMVDNPNNPVTDEKVTLGRMLYYDNRFSKNHDLSCNSCHQLDNFGVDGEATSPGHKGARGDRNSPTVYNAALHMAQFWDGREPDVEAQAKGPVLNPVEMAMPDADHVLKVINSIPEYQEAFATAFGGEDPVNYDNFGNAIGAFERKLMTPGRFDAYLEGDGSALSAEESKGLETFIGSGCITCHMGPGLGGAMYQKMGLVVPYETEDLGRGKITGNEVENYFFKVPSLRNITKTGPYLHDGSVASLDETVRLMAKHQVGRELSDEDVASIISFLGALEGEVPSDLIAEPTLPASTETTPKPDPN